MACGGSPPAGGLIYGTPPQTPIKGAGTLNNPNASRSASALNLKDPISLLLSIILALSSLFISVSNPNDQGYSLRILFLKKWSDDFIELVG